MNQTSGTTSTWSRVRTGADMVSSLLLILAAAAFIWSMYGRAQVGSSRRPLEVPQTPISIVGAAAMGTKVAPIVMIGFSDFECSFCAAFSKETLPALVKDYVDTGRLQFVFKHLPLPMHARAKPAALASECAGAQNNFWPMHDIMFKNQRNLTDYDLTTYATSIGLDERAFQTCLGSAGASARVSEDAQLAGHLGLSGTPAFLLGRRTHDNQVTVSSVITGARPLDEFVSAIDALLAS